MRQIMRMQWNVLDSYLMGSKPEKVSNVQETEAKGNKQDPNGRLL